MSIVLKQRKGALCRRLLCCLLLIVLLLPLWTEAGICASGIGTIDADMQFTVLKDKRIDGRTVTELRRGSDGLIYRNCREP